MLSVFFGVRLLAAGSFSSNSSPHWLKWYGQAVKANYQTKMGKGVKNKMPQAVKRRATVRVTRVKVDKDTIGVKITPVKAVRRKRK